MEIKCYDEDILIVKCNRYKYSSHFKTLKGKWIDIKGKNHFAISKKYESDLQKIVDDIKTDEETSKYSRNDVLKIKEEYYKSFDCKPINFGGELNCSNRSKKSVGSLSSSSYGDCSSSSDGFPSPETPGKKEEEDEEEDDDIDFEFMMDKLCELEKRIEKLEKKQK